MPPIRKKHIFFYALFLPLVILFLKLRFGYRYEKAKDLPDNYIVLSNHVTDYDMLLVGASFSRQMYFVGSEHIARWKLLYRFLKTCFAPIMRPKGASAASAIIEMMKAVKQGANVCLFAEGVRSWDGAPSPIAPSTARMVKRLGCGLVTYRIKGGYFVSPMWSGASVRRGWLQGAPVHVYTREQLAGMSNEELYAAICADLGEDAYERQLAAPRRYRSREPARGLENLLFICPECGWRDTFRSQGDTVKCSHCGFSFRYTEYGMLEGAPFATLKEFSDRQKEQVRADWEQGVVYTAPSATLTAIRKHEETPVGSGEVSLSAQSLRCGDTEFPLESISDLAMHGQHTLVFTADKNYYELIVAPGSNALKFFLYYNACKCQAPEKAV